MSEHNASELAPKKSSRNISSLIKILVVILLGKIALDLFIPTQNNTFEFNAFDAEQELIESTDPIKYLAELWPSGKIPQRRFVVTRLRNQANNEEKIEFRKLLLDQCLKEGINDADIQLRELILSATARIHSSLRDDYRYSKGSEQNSKKDALLKFEEEYFIPACLVQLEDFDPVVNTMGIRYARGLENRKSLSTKVIELLDTPNPELLSQAAGYLRLVTGEDYGILLKDLPDKGDVRKAPGIKEKISQWDSYMKENSNEYLEAFNGIKTLERKNSHLSHDYMKVAGKTMKGKSIQLQDYSGKLLVLSFWASWCTPCEDELPILDKIQKENSDSLKILTVSLDGVPSIHGIKDDDGNIIDDTSGNTPQNRQKIENMLEKTKVELDVIWDFDNKLAPRYEGGNLPAHAIYDGSGHLVRVFGGSRTEDAWNKIINGIQKMKPAH